PVPLDLVHPAAVGYVLGLSRKHRPVVTGRACLRRGVVLLAQDQPVLRIARELRRDERVGAVETLAVQTDREAAVLLLLDELVGALVPDLHRAGAVLPLRDLALEGRVLERMVLDVDRKMLLPGLERRAFGD